MKKIFTVVLIAVSFGAFAQTGIGTTTPDASAQLDISSTTKGFLAPRMTAAQRTAITSPATALLVYQTDAPAGYYYYNSTGWVLIGSAQWSTAGSDVYYNSGKVGIGTASPGHKLTLEGIGISNTGVFGIDVTGDALFTWASTEIAPNLTGGNNLIHLIGQEESEYNSGYIGFNYQGDGSASNFLTFGLHTHDNLLNLNGAGNVGIGTTTPSYKLDVNGAINGTSVLVNGVPVASSTDTYWNTAGSGAIYYSGGNIGIGTVSPNSALEIGVASGSGWSSSIRFTRSGTPNADSRIAVANDGLIFRNFDSSTSTQFSFRDFNDVHIWDLKSGGRSLFNGASDDEAYSVQIGGTNSLRTEGKAIFNGNVCIGTTNPGAKLQVTGDQNTPNSEQLIITGSTNTNKKLRLGYNTTDNYGIIQALTYGSSYDPLLLNPDGGNVCIGTTSPDATLHVYRAGAGDGHSIIESEYGSDGGRWTKAWLNRKDTYDNWYGLYISSDAVDPILVAKQDGNVGIGTTNPSYPLEISGSSINEGITTNYFSLGSGTSIINTTNGNVSVSVYATNDIMTSGAFLAVSDKRIKENITEIQGSLDLIKKLRPVTYNKIDKIEYGGKTEFGFIAQEVEEVIPYAVNSGKGEVPVLKSFENVNFEEGVTYTLIVKNGTEIKEQTYTTDELRPEGEIIVKSKIVNDFKSLTYDYIFTVAVDAIQELQQEVEGLKSQNAALTQKTDAIDQLKAEVENLKKMISTEGEQLSEK